MLEEEGRFFLASSNLFCCIFAAISSLFLRYSLGESEESEEDPSDEEEELSSDSFVSTGTGFFFFPIEIFLSISVAHRVFKETVGWFKSLVVGWGSSMPIFGEAI